MQREVVNLNGVPTKIITWGKSVKDASEGDPVESLNYVICIPGNPGITEFYIEFLERIYEKTNNVVWIVGHAGHEVIDKHDMPEPDTNKDLYSLEGQIKHKISFIENYVPENAKVTFIGHSIGTYIILKLLKVPSIKQKVVNNYLLFPTIEYLAESRNGIFVTKYLKYFIFMMLPLVKIFNILPQFVQMFCLYTYCKVSSMPSVYADIIKNFINPSSTRNVVSMAMDEMKQLRERDNEVLTDNLSTIKLYYGSTDGWTPLSYYTNIKKEVPEINAEVCDKGFAHAFVLKHSVGMADKVVEWMQTR